MIEVEHISKDLGEFFLNDVSLTIDNGEYFMLLGPTGAGKTILLETMAGIYRPDKGKVLLNGRDITGLPPRERNIGMVYQDYMLFPHMTVRKNILFGLRNSSVPKAQAEQRAGELEELLGIHHLLHRYPGTLSGGEQQRVAIARALIVDPEVLLLDEPLSALDTETRKKLRDELRKIHQLRETTIVHVTHSFDEAFLLGSQMAIMNAGQVVQVGEPGEVFRKPNSKFSADFLGVTNLFQGTSVINNGTADIDIGNIRVTSAVTDFSGQVHVSVRPESILLSRERIESSARNSFRGKITGISDVGTVIMVEMNINVPIIAAITHRSYHDMELNIGSDVWLTFKAADVHVF